MAEKEQAVLEFSSFEKKVISDLKAWQKKQPNFFQKFEGVSMKALGWFIDKPAAAVSKRGLPAVKWLLEKTHQTAFYTFSHRKVYRVFGRQDTEIQGLSDIQKMNLEVQDKAAGAFYLPNLCMTVFEGAATGVWGLPGLLIDLPAMFMANFRMIQQMGTCYGYDMEGPSGLLLSMAVMDYSAADIDKKVEAMMEIRLALDHLERRVLKKAAADGEAPLIMKMIQKSASSLGVKITDEQIGKMIPILGAGIGAVWNARFLQQNADNARRLFQYAYLRKKYGSDRLGEELSHLSFPIP